MTDPNVLVVFYSRHGTAEQLALAAGLGALQAGANIRLRRLADLADQQTIDASASWKENLKRMNRDYVAPRPADPVWADVVILAARREPCAELEQYVESLRSAGSMRGKIAAPLAPDGDVSALRPIYASAACAGLIVAPAEEGPGDAVEAARLHGERVARLARRLKEAEASS